MSVAVLVPVLNRPHRIAPLVASIRAATPDPYSILFVCDSGDTASHLEIIRQGCDFIAPGGSYARKIRAGVEATTEPLVALMADDVVFHAGWLENAQAEVENGAEVVGLNDLRPRGDQSQATHFLVTRKYCELPTIDGGPGPLHAGYAHNFPDRELVATAAHRGVYAFAADAVVEHRHHLDGNAAYDQTYRKGQATFRRDQRLFRLRSQLWA